MKFGSKIKTYNAVDKHATVSFNSNANQFAHKFEWL